LHIDLSTYEVQSIEGAKYVLVAKDCYSSYKTVIGLSTQKAYRQALREIVKRHNNGVYPKKLRIDNAGEMVSRKSMDFYRRKHIFIERIAAYHHFQNQRAESGMYSLDTRTRLAIVNCNVPKSFWLLAMYYSTEIENVFLPTNRGSDISCYEAFTENKPDGSLFKTFGCLAYLHIPSSQRLQLGRDKKLDDTAKCCVFQYF